MRPSRTVSAEARSVASRFGYVTGTADTTVSPYFRLPLAAALDSAGIEWFTGSAGIDWFGQTAVSADAVDAADPDGQAGDIHHPPMSASGLSEHELAELASVWADSGAELS